MTDSDAHVLKGLIKYLLETRASVTKIILVGIEDQAEYRESVGKVKGINWALDYISEELKKAESGGLS